MKPQAIDPQKVLRYLGSPEARVTKEMAELLDICSQEVLACMEPRYIYRLLPLRLDDGGCDFGDGELFLPSKSLVSHLKGCRQGVLWGVTLSLAVDRLLRRVQVADTAKAAVLSCCASVAVEEICDLVEQEIKNLWPRGRAFFTNRFSPGYGDLSLSVQRDFLRVLDAPRKIGLTANEAWVLIPSKSVTAVVGIGDQPLKQKISICKHCTLEDRCRSCHIRKSLDE